MKPVVFLTLIAMAGCTSLTLAPSDFAWPVESELTADRNGMVREDRYHLAFGLKPLLFSEFQDSLKVEGKTIRIIRDRQGYYFVTGPKFKNVYVFEHAEAGLVQVNKILVNEAGLGNPALNQRPPHIQLLNGREKPILLTRKGVQVQEQGGSK